MVLVQNGTSRYVIALATDAIPAEKTAARELSEYVRQISGATLEVKPESEVDEAAPQILVGAGLRAKRLIPTLKWNELGHDGIVIKTSGNKLILAGGRPRGALYATYHFLENTLGVRWWAPDATTVPRKRSIVLPVLNTVYVPQFKTREAFYSSTVTDATFATRLKNNGHNQTQDAEWGGHNSILGNVHTFTKLLPIEKYFETHPEWFSDPENGGKPCTAASKMPSDWQLCLTSEAARLELTKNALEWIRQNPEAGMISISQNDNQVRCTAPEDLAIEEREGSPSGPLLKFANAVAVDIEKEYPDFLVETLAYQYTRKPPRFERPRGNVVIRLCSIEADFSRPLDSPANSGFRGDVLAWKAIAPRLYIWDYVANYKNVILPHPNMRVLGPNIKFFAANNVIGLFEQGDAYSNGAGDMIALRAWVLSHLMWDPRLDQTALENEFLAGYYGAAAPYMRAYIDEMQDALARSGGTLGVFQSDLTHLGLDAMNEATWQLRYAEEAVRDDATISKRLRRDRLALDHAWLLRYKSLRAEAGRRGAAFEGPKDGAAAAAQFVATAREFAVPQYAESESFDLYAPSLLARFTPPAPLPDFLKDAKEADIIDSQEGDYRLFIYKNLGMLVDDAKASNGRAARMDGQSSEWIIQATVQADRDFLGDDRWHGYIVARVEAKQGIRTGTALSYGIYDTGAKKVITEQSQTLEEIGDGEYHFIDLGVHQLNPAMYVFAAPPRGQGVEAVFVDRILFVREGRGVKVDGALSFTER